jgi:hypothetical protein
LEGDVRNVFNISLQKTFGHFASGSLPYACRLKPGPLAQQFSASRWGMFPNEDLGGAFTPQIIKTILDFVSQIENPTLMSLYHASSQDMPPWQMEHLCLWALKYGILSIDDRA